jgi:flagellar basal body-associated protein FliL
MVNVQRKPSRDRSGIYAIATIVSAAVVLSLLIHRKETGSWGLSSLSWPLSEESGQPGQAAVGPVVNLPKVIVRVGAAESDVYVHAAFDLEVASEQDKEAVRKLMPRLRHATIDVLSTMSAGEARGGTHAMTKTKARLLDQFRKVIPDRHLEALYVTSFLAFESQ